MKKSSSTKKAKNKALEPNPNNTWQQHPNIKSPVARARAYLIEAGLILKSNKSKKITDVLDPQLDLINSPEAKFGRLLASPDQRIRHSTIQKLSTYLKKRCDLSNENGGISELDLMKLWKGLWYTLYLCDKAPVQDDVSKKLCQLLWSFCGTDEDDEYAGSLYLEMEQDCGSDDDNCSDEDDIICSQEGDLPDMDDGDDGVSMDDSEDDEDNIDVIMKSYTDEHEDESDDEHRCDQDNCTHRDHETSIDDFEIKHCRGAHLASLYVRTFFRTIRREWSNMDKYRVDKFYTCMRYMLRETYTYMSKRNWNLGIIRLFNDTIFEEILSQTPNGPRYHLIDIALEELVHVNAESALPLTEATYIDCMEPFFALLQILDDATVHSRIVEKILQRFLLQYSVLNQSDQSAAAEIGQVSLDRSYIFTEVHVGTVAEFIFDIASNENTQDRYRKVLYDTHKQYMKRLKEVGHDVVIESDSNAEGDSADEEEDFSHTDNRPILQNGNNVKDINTRIDEKAIIGEAEVQTVHNFRKSTMKPVRPKAIIEEKQKRCEKSNIASSNLKLDSVVPQKPVVYNKKCELSDQTVKKAVPDVPVTENIIKPQQRQRQEIDLRSRNDKKSQSDKKLNTLISSDNSNGHEISHRNLPADSEPTASRGEEKVVTISIDDQKMAVKTTNMTAKSQSLMVKLTMSEKLQPTVPKPAKTDFNKKKVKFGKQNMSKSYTASLNDLRKIDPKEILEKRPGESILRSPTKKRTQIDMSKQGKKFKRHK